MTLPHHPPPFLEFHRPHVCPVHDGLLVDQVPAIPDRTPALHDRDDLLPKPVRERVLPAQPVLPLIRGRDDPLDRDPAALSDVHGYGQVEGLTTAAGALDGLDPQERRDRVDGEGEVSDRVEREGRRIGGLEQLFEVGLVLWWR